MSWAVIDVYWRAVIVYSSSSCCRLCGCLTAPWVSNRSASTLTATCAPLVYAQMCFYSCVSTVSGPHVLCKSFRIASVLMWFRYIHSFDTFLQSMSMRSRWSYIAWICVFSLGAFRTFCIPSNEGKTWDLGKVVFAGIWWLTVTGFRKENIVLEVKVLQWFSK